MTVFASYVDECSLSLRATEPYTLAIFAVSGVQ